MGYGHILGYPFKSTFGGPNYVQEGVPDTCKIVNILIGDLLLVILFPCHHHISEFEYLDNMG